ncbi:MAG: tetratricopeptide repeat protein [bacterium]|nr:tetratricopeptide repeat protein [bacterium]
MAVELYRQAIAIDPDNARAWAGLSFVYGYRVAYGHGEYDQEHPIGQGGCRQGARARRPTARGSFGYATFCLGA